MGEDNAIYDYCVAYASVMVRIYHKWYITSKRDRRRNVTKSGTWRWKAEVALGTLDVGGTITPNSEFKRVLLVDQYNSSPQSEISVSHCSSGSLSSPRFTRLGLSRHSSFSENLILSTSALHFSQPRRPPQKPSVLAGIFARADTVW